MKGIKTEIFGSKMNTNLLLDYNCSDVSILLKKILELLLLILKADIASVLMLEASGSQFRLEFTSENIDIKRVFDSLNSIEDCIIRNNKGAIINKIETYPLFDLSIQENIDYKLKNMIVAPIRLNNACIGILEGLNKFDGNEFTREDLEILELFSGNISIGYQNVLAYRMLFNKKFCLKVKSNHNSFSNKIVAKNHVVRARLALCKKIAEFDTSVLILGEHGVGKSLIAEYIHIQSKRAGKFIRINCANTSVEMFEKALFGYYNDESGGKISQFEIARDGSIYLDEICDMALSTQAKLLRVLQKMQLERIGYDKAIPINARIIASTTKNIEQLVEQGKFRKDLYCWLNTVPINIPPLRNRREDIVEFAALFLKRFSKENEKEFLGFSQKAIEMMLEAPWYNNIPELRNAVELACVVGIPPYIETTDLFIRSAISSLVYNNEFYDMDLKNAVIAFKKIHITKNLEKYKWNQTVTAKSLGIQRTYLSRLIKELGIKES